MSLGGAARTRPTSLAVPVRSPVAVAAEPFALARGRGAAELGASRTSIGRTATPPGTRRHDHSPRHTACHDSGHEYVQHDCHPVSPFRRWCARSLCLALKRCGRLRETPACFRRGSRPGGRTSRDGQRCAAPLPVVHAFVLEYESQRSQGFRCPKKARFAGISSRDGRRGRTRQATPRRACAQATACAGSGSGPLAARRHTPPRPQFTRIWRFLETGARPARGSPVASVPGRSLAGLSARDRRAVLPALPSPGRAAPAGPNARPWSTHGRGDSSSANYAACTTGASASEEASPSAGAPVTSVGAGSGATAPRSMPTAAYTFFSISRASAAFSRR